MNAVMDGIRSRPSIIAGGGQVVVLDDQIRHQGQTRRPLRTIVITIVDQELIAEPAIDDAARSLRHAIDGRSRNCKAKAIVGCQATRRE